MVNIKDEKEVDNTRNGQEIDNIRDKKEIDMIVNGQERDNARNDQEMDNTRNGQEMDNIKGHNEIDMLQETKVEGPVHHPVYQPVFQAVIRPEHPRLKEIRQNFGIFGGLSLVYGIAYTLLFYKAERGLNVFVFSLLLLILERLIMKTLGIEMKKGTKYLYLGICLLGLSTVLTSNQILLAINSVSILLLLEISMIHQLFDDKAWDPFYYLWKMVCFLFNTIGSLAKPFVHGKDFFKSTKIVKNPVFLQVLLGLVIGLPIVMIVLSLLVSADMVFGSMTKEIVDGIFGAEIFYLIFKLGVAMLTCYCIICGIASGKGEMELSQSEKPSAVIAITFMSLIGLIYVIFCGIQVAFLFQNEFFALPSNMTYAEYARSGFYELVIVTFLNIILILVGTIVFSDHKVLRVIMTIISGCTYIMIISATYRMFMYIEAYGITFLRLFALLFLWMDALVLAGVIRYIYHKKFPLFYYAVTVITVSYLIFSFARVDYWIAKDFVTRNPVKTIEGMNYLFYDISEDGASLVLPYLMDFSEEGLSTWEDYDLYRGEIQVSVESYIDNIKAEWEDRGIRDFNLSVMLANKAVVDIQENIN